MLAPNRQFNAQAANAPARVAHQPRIAFLVIVALTLAACGGGDSESPELGAVRLKVTTAAGAPIGGAHVNNLSATPPVTDLNGEVTIKNLLPGEQRADVTKPGYFMATRSFEITSGAVKDVTIALERVTVATPVVLATHSVASNDGKTLTVDVDLALLDENGTSWETLTPSAFEVIGGGICDNGTCGIDSQGREFHYTARVDRSTFSFTPARSRPAIAAAVLLEQSAAMTSFDPTGQRLKAVNSFFESITSPDVVALGSYQRVAGRPVLQTYGGFTSDAKVFRTVIDAMSGQEQGSNPRGRAVADMIAFMDANPPAGPDDLQRAVVLVTQGQPKDSTDNELPSLAASRVSVVAISARLLYPDPGEYTKIGDAFVLAQDPEQLPVVFRALGSIVGRSLAHNRVRIVLDTTLSGAFAPGSRAMPMMSVRVSAQTVIGWLPITARL